MVLKIFHRTNAHSFALQLAVALVFFVSDQCIFPAQLLAQTDVVGALTVDPVPARYSARVPLDATLDKLPLFPRRTQFARPMVPSRYMVVYGFSAAGEKRGTFGVIDFRRGELVKRFDDQIERIVDVIAISPDGRLAAVAVRLPKEANDLEVWDLVAEKPVSSRKTVMFRANNNEQKVVVFLDDKRLLIVDGSQPRKVYSVIDARSGRTLKRFGDRDVIPRNEIGISAGGRYVVIGTNADLNVWNTHTSENVFSVEFPQNRKYGSNLPSFSGAAFADDGTSLVAFLQYGNRYVDIHQWNIPSLDHTLTPVDLIPTRPRDGLDSIPVQQIPGTQQWLYFNLPILRSGVQKPLATMDPKNQSTIHGAQWVVNDRMVARRVIATEQRGGLFYRLVAVPIPR